MPTTVSGWVIVAASRTNRARIAAHGAMLRAAFPIRRSGHSRLAGGSGRQDRGVVDLVVVDARRLERIDQAGPRYGEGVVASASPGDKPRDCRATRRHADAGRPMGAPGVGFAVLEGATAP